MKTTSTLLTAGAFIAASTMAFANPNDNPYPVSGFYVGALAGAAKTDFYYEYGFADGEDFNKTGPAFGLKAGYQFNRFLATELTGYYFAASPSGTTTQVGETIDVKSSQNAAVLLSIKGLLPLTPRFHLFASLGLGGLSFKQKAYFYSTGQTSISHKSYPALGLGAGLGYNLTQNVELTLQYEGISNLDAISALFDSDASYQGGVLGINYHFH